ncbi:MAG: hypothetical protein PUI59_00435 [bacterium]|nr:hypothetical protein [bacterium]
MTLFEENAIYSIQAPFSLSSLDEEVLSLLYLPILKKNGYSLYESLLRRESFLKERNVELVSDLISDLGMEKSEFLKARESLEAIGLLETYRKESDGFVSYLYKILPPASPKKFFSDILLKQLLHQVVEEKRFIALKAHFRLNQNQISDGYIEQSAKFQDVFFLEVKEGDITSKEDNVELIDKRYKEIYKLDEELLKQQLSFEQIPLDVYLENHDPIIEIATLYGLKEEEVARLMKQSISSDHVFYLDEFKKSCRENNIFQQSTSKKGSAASLGKKDLSMKIQTFNESTPQNYLSCFYNAEPSKLMLKFIEQIKEQFHFKNGVINVILDYSLKATKGEFNEKFIEKVCYSLQSQKVSDTYDAILSLSNRSYELNRKRKGKKAVSISAETEVNKESNSEEKEENQPSRADLDKIRKEFGL